MYPLSLTLYLPTGNNALTGSKWKEFSLKCEQEKVAQQSCN